MTRRFAMLTLVVTGLTVGTVACGGESAADWMAEARTAHAEADRVLEAGDRDEARRVLESFFERPAPDSINKDDARVVRQDVCYRLSRISLEDEDAAAAMEWAERGLNQGAGNDVFTANLYVARGQAREALGQAIEAAADYHDALKINDLLLDETLDGDEP